MKTGPGKAARGRVMKMIPDEKLVLVINGINGADDSAKLFSSVSIERTVHAVPDIPVRRMVQILNSIYTISRDAARILSIPIWISNL